MKSILTRLKEHPMPLTWSMSLVIPMGILIMMVLVWTKITKYTLIDPDTMTRVGGVFVHDQLYLLTAYITIGFLATYSLGSKVLSWIEMSYLRFSRFHTSHDIYAYSKAMNAYIQNPLLAIAAVFDKRVRKRGKIWFIFYLFCILVSIMNSLAPPALPLLLKSNFIYLKVTQVVSQIPSDALTEKLGNLTSKGSVDNIVFMARQIYDGQYLWEKVYKDKYMPEDRAYEYVSNWGHASDNYRIDGGYPRSTPMPGKTLDVVGLDGFLSSIKCHVVNCDGNDDCSPKTVVSDIQRTQAPNRMGITNLEFYNNYSGIQYQVFWGSDSKNGSAINVSGQDTTGMIREAKIDNKMDAEGGYSGNSQLSPGSIKVNCDYTVLNKNGKNDSTPLVVTNTEFFNYNPFADIIFTQGSSNITLGEDTLHSLLSEENILRNLTYGIQNSFRLLNTRLFRSLQANLLQSNLGLGSGFIEWGVESNLRGYDSWIIIYASIFLSIILLLNILDFALMDDENYMLPVSYTQDINTRLSVLALSGIPPSDEYEKLFRYSFGSRRNSMIEMYQKIETLIHQKIGGLGGNGQRMDEGVLFAWENGVFLPHYDEPKYKRIMKRKGLNPTRSIVIHIPPDLNLSNATTAVEQQPDNYLTSNGRGAA